MGLYEYVRLIDARMHPFQDFIGCVRVRGLYTHRGIRPHGADVMM